MTDKSAYGGLFQDPPYLSSDADPNKTDPYDKQDCIPSRYLGKSMTVGGRIPPGEHPDAYFDKKYVTLASSEQNNGNPVGYDENKWRTLAAEQHKKNAISNKEFRYSSHTQKSTGPGSYFGCFQDKPFEYMTEPWDDGKSKGGKSKKSKKAVTTGAAEEKTHLPNIRTGPAKKGTYGYPGLLIGNPSYNENWRAEDAAADAEHARWQRLQTAPGKQLGPPMHLSGISRKYLDELPNTGVPSVYTSYAPPADGAGKRGASKKQAAAVAAPVAVHDKPFCGSASRSGEQGCINPFPNKWVSPDEVKPTKAALLKQQNQEKEEAERRAKAAPVWRPNSFEKTSVISSCLRRFY